MRELLAVEVGRAGRLELREVELLARALLGGVRGGLLGGGRGEVQVAGFVEGEPAAFPELGMDWLVFFLGGGGFVRRGTYEGVGELDVEVADLDGGGSVAVEVCGRGRGRGGRWGCGDAAGARGAGFGGVCAGDGDGACADERASLRGAAAEVAHAFEEAAGAAAAVLFGRGDRCRAGLELVGRSGSWVGGPGAAEGFAAKGV